MTWIWLALLVLVLWSAGSAGGRLGGGGTPGGRD